MVCSVLLDILYSVFIWILNHYCKITKHLGNRSIFDIENGTYIGRETHISQSICCITIWWSLCKSLEFKGTPIYKIKLDKTFHQKKKKKLDKTLIFYIMRPSLMAICTCKRRMTMAKMMKSFIFRTWMITW